MKGTGLPIGKPVLLLIRPLFRKNLVLTEHEVMGPKLTQAEGFVLGVGANMFKIAGPVIVYGTIASVIYGVIYWITILF
ncbi:MAG: SpoVA/SpoVAEb family sporulation membrane protein [Oscillospiraceae bacterium]|nr:SpoVA/SpoVAEb family sporulation membrane protein [Oscillospiraceae bacterium]